MGEIATWSAVKTKVGLGKDSNECPTKAELLALSPTGTGENYVGLEISNASSYGNNETVQLSDIHKVTYKYTFTVDRTTLSFPASGGAPSPNLGFGLVSRKQKYVDGVISGSYTEVGSTQTAYPDWVSYNQTVPQYEAKENTGLVERSANMTFTQNESGKQITVQFTQDAGVETWEYTFTSKNNSLVFNAIGGKGTPTELTITSNKQKYINGKAVGSPVNVDYSRPSLPSWLSVESGYYEALENKSESSRSYTDTLTQAESGKKLTLVLSQAAGVKTYGTPTVYLGSIADIPASGGTAATPTYTYSQLWGWNGKTNDGGTISSGASVVWSENISGSNLGTTAKARTKLGSRTLTVTLKGKSGNASIDIYQAENKITNVTQGTWVVSISANPSAFTEQGGTSQISASARAPRTNHWSSGATNAASDAIGTPTLSIPTASTGFSLSGTTLTVAENTTANQRSVVVRATMDTVYKEVTVTQSAYLVEWEYTFTASPTTLSFDALGTAKSITITSYREKYINGSLVEGSRENVSYIHATSTEHIGTVLGTSISMQENQTTSTRSGQVSYEQNGSNKVIRITCNQAAGTISTRDVLEIVDNFGDSPAVGGSIFGLVKSGYYDVINGRDSTWHNVTPTLKSKSSYITNVEITKTSGDGYNIGITLSENTSESSRRASLTLTYGSKELDMATTQAGASVSYNYYFGVTTDFPPVAAAGATPKAVIKSRRHKVVNGVEESSYNLVETSVISKPNWTGTLSAKVSSTSGSGADYDVTIPVYENTEASIRRGTVVLQQGGSGKQLTLNLNQLAASITTRDYINYVEPIPDGMFSALAQSITVTLQSYRETLINGKVTSKVAVQPDFDLDSTVTDWASVDLIGGNPTNYEYDFEVSVKENTTNQTRSGSVMFYNGAAEVENAWAFTQDAATISTRYEISWTANYSNGIVEENVTEVVLEGTTGMENSVRMDLHILEYTSINGVEGTPTSWDSRTIAENNLAIASPSGQVSATLQSDSENAFIGITNSVQNLAEYHRTHTITLYNPKVVIKGKEVGTVPTITLIVNPIPYNRVFEFGWKQEGSTITNITLDGDIYGSSAGSRNIISYASLRRDGVEFAKKYIKPTFIPPSEDWLQVIDNGQNSDNSYNWAFKALTNNKGDSARNQQVRFEQPGNDNQALYAYVSQDPVATTELNCELGNYYSYGASDIVNIGFGWSSKDGGNTTGSGGMDTPGGYLGARISLPAENDRIDMYAVGKPTYGKPLKIKLSNIRKVKKISYDNNQYTGLSVGYSQQDYKLGIVMGVGMESYFHLTPSIISESGEYGGGIQIQVTLKQTYNGYNGDSIADITLTPKDSNLPTLYLNIAWGNP
nr:MAG TPA: cellulase [Caudoviricetes sp.]